MKKILLASGCSWTNKNFVSDIHPEMDTSWPKWPEMVAEKLNMECINVGHSGAGNEFIFNSIVDECLQLDPSRIGLVIVGWSKYERRDWEKYWPSRPSGDLKWTNKSIDDVGNTHYFIKRSLRHYFNFQTFCEHFNIPYKHCQMITPFHFLENKFDTKNDHYRKVTEKACMFKRKDLIKTFFQSPYIDNIKEENFIGWPVLPEMDGFNLGEILIDKRHTISDLDHHPNATGQRMIADYIYENL